MIARKIRKDGKPDQRVERREKKLAQLERYLKEPRSIEECRVELNCYDRTIYFLIEELNKRGKTIVRAGPHRAAKYLRLAP